MIGHSTNKGYPYEKVESRSAFPNRPDIWLEEGKVRMDIDPEVYGTVEFDPDPTKRTDLEDFLFFRLRDYSESLKVAEGQIIDLLSESHFSPEIFGFDLVHKNKEVTEPPVRIYQSKFNPQYTLFRKPGTPDDKEWNPMLWTLMKKNEDNSFVETELNLPCHRIAYATFYALGIQIEEPLQVVVENVAAES